VFGICLLNDWSARDIQAWEYQPLGPFLSKNFATTISPWVVTLEARLPRALQRPADDPQPLPYLDAAANRAEGAFDIQLEVGLQTRACARPARRCGDLPHQLPPRLLDRGADADPPHGQRLQPAARRPAGQRHPVGPRWTRPAR
jgi:hypothetical protein